MNNLAQVLPVGAAVAPAPKPVAAYGPQDEQFRQLVDAAVNRDPVATQRVLESIRPIVLRYCRARIGRLDRSFASADDVVQEVCLSVISALPSYRDQGQPFLAFVYGIAQHKSPTRTGRRRATGRCRCPRCRTGRRRSRVRSSGCCRTS
jgi:RNA polymerase sigma-70 factor (ECF subfamily)